MLPLFKALDDIVQRLLDDVIDVFLYDPGVPRNAYDLDHAWSSSGLLMFLYVIVATYNHVNGATLTS
jgi:hypothetical protein